SLVDLIKIAVEGNLSSVSTALRHKGGAPELVYRTQLSEPELRRVFPESTSGGGVPAGTWWDFGKQWIGRAITWKINQNGTRSFMSVDPPLDKISQDRQKFEQSLTDAVVNPFAGRIFKRLLAERDIRPETEHSGFNIQPTGQGATNAVQ